MQLADLLNVGGLAVVIVLALQIVKPLLTSDQIAKWTPTLAVVLGIVVALAVSITQGADVAQAVLTGFLAGTSAAGLYDVARPPIVATLDKVA
jgi:hypothetical protein